MSSLLIVPISNKSHGDHSLSGSSCICGDIINPRKAESLEERGRATMEKKCGCWAVLRRGVSGSCKSSASKDSANSIPRTSLVYDAGIYLYVYLDILL